MFVFSREFANASAYLVEKWSKKYVLSYEMG
ncbi:hypothetical protein VPHD485_0218 [Vibrio phage D485]